MRVLWATCGLAVAASALTGVLIGVYLDGVNDHQQAETPASTWITGRPSTSSSTTTSTVVSTSAATSSAGSTTKLTTTSATIATSTPPPPPVTTQAPTTTTTPPRTRDSEWPCSPLNLFPPPHCGN